MRLDKLVRTLEICLHFWSRVTTRVFQRPKGEFMYENFTYVRISHVKSISYMKFLCVKSLCGIGTIHI